MGLNGTSLVQIYLKNSLGSLKETYGSINSAWTYVINGNGVGFPK